MVLDHMGQRDACTYKTETAGVCVGRVFVRTHLRERMLVDMMVLV